MQSDASAQQQPIESVMLGADDLKTAASILYKAYHDDPLFLDIFRGEDEGYESRLRAAIREELNAFWEAGQPMVGLFWEQRLVAVACLNGPDSSVASGRFWHWRLKMLLTAGYLGTKQMVEKEERVRSHIPHQHYHMLAFIGVHPDHQHQGLGHALMAAIDAIVFEHERSEGVAVYVTVPTYLPFFEHGHYHMLSDVKVANIHGQVLFRSKGEQ